MNVEIDGGLLEQAILSAITPERIDQIAEKIIRERLQLVTVKEAMKLLKMGENQVNDLPLKVVRLGDKKKRFRLIDIENHINKATEK